MTLSRTTLPLAALLALTGCGEPTALDLFLVADPNVNSEDALVSRLSRLKVTIDSPAGLYDSAAPCSGEPGDGEVQVCDIDGDQQGELVAYVDLADLGRLPLIRVERGGLADQPLEFRLDGLGPDDKTSALVALAAGGVQGIHFDEGAVLPVQVPFNLRAQFRPPRVTQVYPEHGTSLKPVAVGSVVLIFSKAMNPASLAQAGVIQLLGIQGSQETPVPAKQIVVGEVYSGGPTRVDYRLGDLLVPGSYRVRVSQGALDGSGRPLDQVPMQPGNQPFSSGFDLGADVATQVTCPEAGCELAWCGNGGDTCPDGLRCEDGICMPDGCPMSCGILAVCDKTLGVCVDDCRVHGSYCGEGRACDPATGLCVD